MIELPPQVDEWHKIAHAQPPRGVLVQFKQEYKIGLYTRWIGTIDEIRPGFDLTGVSWKLTGIGRQQIDERAHLGERVMIVFPKTADAGIYYRRRLSDSERPTLLSELVGGPR